MNGSADPPRVRPADPGGRSHWAGPWLVLLLALPGAAWSVFASGISAAALFGEPPTPGDLATAAAAELSGASLWLVAAVLAWAQFRRVVVPLLCGAAAAAYALAALSAPSSDALSEAGMAGWLSAWGPPTSWAIGCWALFALLGAAWRRRRPPPRTR